MPVKEADPDAQALDAAFATAMDAPAKPREPGPPPEIDPAAPHGRDPETGEPLAPFGLTKDGVPRKSAAGRRSADDKPRTTDALPGNSDGKPGVPVPARDYTKTLSEFADACWFMGSALGKGGSAIPFVGKYIPEQKVAAQAGVFRAFKPQLVGAVNIAAQHNARAARFAASIETGELTWVVMSGFMIMPFLTASAAIWKGGDALAQAGMLSVDELAKKNDEQLEEFLANVNAQMEALAAEAQEQAGVGAAE